MSPEQINNDGEITHKSDIWSLAVTMHEACTLSRTFEGNNLEEVKNAITNAEPTSVAEKGYSSKLDDLL